MENVTETGREVRSPTLPLPPPRAAQIEMEDFIEMATRAVLRAVASGLNPQPLPPQTGPSVEAAVAPLNPQPLPPGNIVVGIIYTPRDVLTAAAVQPRTVEA